MRKNLTTNEDIRFFEDNNYEISPTRNQLFMLCKTIKSLYSLAKHQKESLELSKNIIKTQKESLELSKNIIKTQENIIKIQEESLL